MEKVRRHSRLCRKASGIATTVFFAFLSLAPAHAGIDSIGDVVPDPFSLGDTTLSVALSVGNTFPGSVSIGEGSTLTTLGGAFIGNLELGTMEVLGTWNDNTFINIGYASTGEGELIVGPVGTLNGNEVKLGVLDESIGNATVLGTLNTNIIIVGSIGTGSLTIENGGAVSSSSDPLNSTSGLIGLNTGSDGTVTVTGAGSIWTNNGGLAVGIRGSGSLTIADGAVVSTETGVIGDFNTDSDGTVTVTGAGSIWNISSIDTAMVVGGLGGKGSLTIADGGSVSNSSTIIVGSHAGSNGMVTVTGTDSSCISSSGNTVGYEGSGSLTIENGGEVQASQMFVGLREDSEGVLVVKNATLDAGIQLGIGYNFGLIGGKASARLVHGTVIANNIFIGANGKLLGTGTITGNVNLEDGGKLSPGLSPGQMIINGDFNFTNGLLELEADSPSLKDELVVSGNVHIGPEAIFNISLGFELIDAFDIGDFFFGSLASFTVDTDFQADQINLFFTADSGMTNGEIVKITLGGREFSVPATVAQPTYVEVSIDIKPGSYPNSINTNAGGVIPVAILTTADFDASTVDPETVALDGAGARGKGKSGKYGSIEDVDGDGDLDLVVQIENVIEWDPEATEATLTGQTYDGIPIQGTDTVNLVPPE